MTELFEITEEMNDWIKTRPENVQRMIELFPPNKLYRLKTTGNRVTIYSYSEDDTLTVEVSGEYNAVMFERRVFGIKPEDLEECDLPDENESLGAVLTEQEDINNFIQSVKTGENKMEKALFKGDMNKAMEIIREIRQEMYND